MTVTRLADGSTVDETTARIMAICKDVFPGLTDTDFTIDDVFPEPS